MLVLGTSAEMRVGSSPTEGNTHIKICTSTSKASLQLALLAKASL